MSVLLNDTNISKSIRACSYKWNVCPAWETISVATDEISVTKDLKRQTMASTVETMTWGGSPSRHSVCKGSLTWNQMALTILLSTNRGRTQRALKTEVKMNSSQDQILVWREGSPWRERSGFNDYLAARGLTDTYSTIFSRSCTYQWPLLWKSAAEGWAPG